ncbi:ECF RNA polymerase sigma factor SigX [bioreactor metagenome]|uniref:ECF RNA polymerase sigma factor SigX n=1 Tax=bioreactor metagenome TaxID=1076179 RepID=A0A644ZMP1_9ZZZZ|nr:RNA polymerase sigma factor [Oscillospiraceae bacterium]
MRFGFGGSGIGSNMEKTCDKAIADFSKGDSTALSVIYDCMSRMIFSVAYAILKDYHDAEDVLQDTMIEIYKYSDTYRQGSNPKAWILAMTRHLSIDVVRKRKSDIPLDELNEIDISEDNAQAASLEVFEILGSLDEDDKQIVIFRLYAGLSYKEIAGIMSFTVSAAQKRYQRALKKLRAEYK